MLKSFTVSMALPTFSFFWPFLFSAVVFMTAVLVLFLYFRGGRRELFERETLFDFAFVAFIGAIVVGRIFDFFLNVDTYNWSITKLMFFNAYGGINMIGAFGGFLTVGFLYLKRRGEPKAWQIMDLSAGPLSLGAAIVSLINYFVQARIINLEAAVSYFLIFFFIKRLEKVKRHAGFFVCFFATCASFLNLASVLFAQGPVAVNQFSARFIVLLLYFIVSALTWYLISKRKLRDDLKDLMALFLLAIFKLKRIITSIHEADNVARSIILLPLGLLKLLRFLVLLLGREIYQSLVDVKEALGFRK